MPHTALITGASAGIGYALSRCFAADHQNLVLVARQQHRLEKAAEELSREFRVTTKVIVADLAQPDALRKIFDTDCADYAGGNVIRSRILESSIARTLLGTDSKLRRSALTVKIH